MLSLFMAFCSSLMSRFAIGVHTLMFIPAIEVSLLQVCVERARGGHEVIRLCCEPS